MSTVPRPKRRFLQFRLRTLLLLFAVASIWLGWKVHQAEKQRRTVAAIQGIMPGGWVSYDYEDRTEESAAVWKWLRDRLGPDMLHDVVSVAIHGFDFQDAKAQLQEDQLQYLLLRLNELPRLREIILWSTPLTDRQLKQVGRLTHLQQLTIFHSEISDDGLPHLATLMRLKTLELDYTAVTQEGIDRLQRALPNCYIEW